MDTSPGGFDEPCRITDGGWCWTHGRLDCTPELLEAEKLKAETVRRLEKAAEFLRRQPLDYFVRQ